MHALPPFKLETKLVHDSDFARSAGQPATITQLTITATMRLDDNRGTRPLCNWPVWTGQHQDPAVVRAAAQAVLNTLQVST